MAKYSDFGCTKCQLVTGEGASAVLHSLNNSIQIFEVFSDEVLNTWIIGNHFESTIFEVISQKQSFNRYIIDIRNS